MRAIPVAVFNANQFPLNVTINRGAAFTVASVNPNTWSSGTVSSGGPGWDNGGASPNNLGPGGNVIQVQLGTGALKSIMTDLPDFDPSSVQVYFFFGQTGIGSVQWFVLYSGSVVASGTSATLESAGSTTY